MHADQVHGREPLFSLPPLCVYDIDDVMLLKGDRVDFNQEKFASACLVNWEYEHRKLRNVII